MSTKRLILLHQRSAKRLPGTDPVKVMTTSDESRPAGTTWVFTDGSRVISSPSGQIFESNSGKFVLRVVVSSSVSIKCARFFRRV